MTTYGYVRAGTEAEARRQEAQLKEAGCDAIWRDTGTRNAPQLNALVDSAGDGGTIVVTELGQLNREPQRVLDVVERLGVRVRTLDGSLDTSSTSGRLQLRVWADGVQQEREMRSERARRSSAARARADAPGKS
jgi:DNA invertase Pin-like site-specific DNA recombinase